MSAPNASDWSLLPGALERVLSEIAAGRERVVECGSGESTVAIGRLLADRGKGSLHSLEHDRHWLAETAARLEREGAAERVELHEAPIRPHPAAPPGCGWYDPAAVDRLPVSINLLLVDGPHGALWPNGETRFPALPLLADRLAPGAVVILDDIHRAAEQRIVERWEQDFAISFDRCPNMRLAIGVFSAALADSATALERDR